MPRYLIRSSFTPDAWSDFVKNPQNRREVIRPLIEQQGGKLEAFYFGFGEDDCFVIMELPGNEQAAAIAIAAASGGALKAVKTTVLMTAEEAEAAMRLASKVQYVTPKGARAPARV
jgi:uncharacterized protein with GYD domain